MYSFGGAVSRDRKDSLCETNKLNDFVKPNQHPNDSSSNHLLDQEM